MESFVVPANQYSGTSYACLDFNALYLVAGVHSPLAEQIDVTPGSSWTATSSDGEVHMEFHDNSGDWLAWGTGSGTVPDNAAFGIACVGITGSFPEVPAPAAAYTYSDSGTQISRPGGPVGLAATPGVESVHLTWIPSVLMGGSPLTGYTLYRSQDPMGPFVLIATVGPGTTSYTDTNLQTGVYHYQVRAVNAAGASPASNTATSAAISFSVPGIDIQIRPMVKIADFGAADSSITTITIERGLFRASALGTFADLPIALARVSGEPEPGNLNHDLGVASTTYTHQEDVCIDGQCEFSVGADLGDDVKIGELWEAELRILVDGEEILSIPFVEVRPE